MGDHVTGIPHFSLERSYRARDHSKNS